MRVPRRKFGLSERQRAALRGDPVASAGEQIADALADLAGLFVGDVRLTLVARHPDNPDADLIVTADDLLEVEAAVRRRREAAGR